MTQAEMAEANNWYDSYVPPLTDEEIETLNEWDFQTDCEERGDPYEEDLYYSTLSSGRWYEW